MTGAAGSGEERKDDGTWVQLKPQSLVLPVVVEVEGVGATAGRAAGPSFLYT